MRRRTLPSSIFKKLVLLHFKSTFFFNDRHVKVHPMKPWIEVALPRADINGSASTTTTTTSDPPAAYALQHFAVPSHYAQDLASILIPHGLIMDRVEALAGEIMRDHLREFGSQNGEASVAPGLVVICVLKGMLDTREACLCCY